MHTWRIRVKVWSSKIFRTVLLSLFRSIVHLPSPLPLTPFPPCLSSPNRTSFLPPPIIGISHKTLAFSKSYLSRLFHARWNDTKCGIYEKIERGIHGKRERVRRAWKLLLRSSTSFRPLFFSLLSLCDFSRVHDINHKCNSCDRIDWTIWTWGRRQLSRCLCKHINGQEDFKLMLCDLSKPIVMSKCLFHVMKPP